jgi:hypothetical protein
MSFLVNPFWYASAGCTDADANAFLTAAGITNPTISAAICTLVTSMKANGTWAKCNAIYPMVGGTATTCKFNLKNPADTNAAFRLNFVGGWSFSANGALPNGLNTYANTFFTPTINSFQNSHHISYYSRTNSNLTEVEFGSVDSGNNGSLIEIRTSNVTYFRVNNGVGTITFSDTDSRAFYLGNRTASNLINAWRNSTKSVQSTTLASSLGTFPYYLGAFDNVGTALYFSRKECAFASIGTGFNDTEAASLYTDVQAFNTTLARQV